MSTHTATVSRCWQVLALILCLNGVIGLKLDVSREIILMNQKYIQRVDIEATNDASTAVDTFTYCGRNIEISNAAALDAFIVTSNDDENGEALAKMVESQPNGVPEGVACVDFDLKKALQPGKSLKLKVMTIISHLITPLPSKKLQNDPQMVLATCSLHTISPYVIKNEKTKVLLQTDTKTEHTAPDPVKFAGKDLELGPFSDVKPFSQETFNVHFESRSALLYALHTTRKIDVSHWGRVRISEEYLVKNMGAEIIGEWSRFDLMTQRINNGNAMYMEGSIPGEAYDLAFRDDIGNISTSKSMRVSEDVRQVALEPRFPLVGGWSTKFLFEYSLPLNVISKQEKTYELSVQSLPALGGMIYDSIETIIYLPEGASSTGEVTISNPAVVSSGKEYSYFDLLGRPTITLRMQNQPSEMNHEIRVKYTFSDVLLYQKPVVVAVAVLAIAAVTLLVSSIDLSAGSGISKLKKQ